MKGKTAAKLDAPVQAEALGQACQLNLGATSASEAIEMELSVRYFALEASEGFDRNIEPLVPLEASGKYDDEFFVTPGARTAVKDSEIDVIEKHRALLSRNRPRNQLLAPKMVRGNYVIDKPC